MKEIQYKHIEYIKNLIEHYYFREKNEKPSLYLKGSLYIDQIIEIEEIIKSNAYYYYNKQNELKVAEVVLIGKMILVIGEIDTKELEILEEIYIDKDNCKVGIEEIKEVYSNNQKFYEIKKAKKDEAYDEFNRLKEDFIRTNKKIKKGEILVDIDFILEEYKFFSVTEVCKQLKISPSMKSILIRRYSLFELLLRRESFREIEKELKNTIENLKDIPLRKLTNTKESKRMSDEEKEFEILSIMKG